MRAVENLQKTGTETERKRNRSSCYNSKPLIRHNSLF